MYICICKKITESQLKDCYTKNSCDYDASQRKLGFSLKCGKCKPSVENLLKKSHFKKIF